MINFWCHYRYFGLISVYIVLLKHDYKVDTNATILHGFIDFRVTIDVGINQGKVGRRQNSSEIPMEAILGLRRTKKWMKYAGGIYNEIHFWNGGERNAISDWSTNLNGKQLNLSNCMHLIHRWNFSSISSVFMSDCKQLFCYISYID